MRRLMAAALVGLMAAGAAPAQDIAIRLEQPWVRRAPALPNPRPGEESATAAYVTLVNRGSAADALVAAASDAAARVELHQTVNESGLMKMERVAKVDLAPGARVELRPGSYHLMLIGLKRALTPGQTVALTLEFQRAGRMTTRAEVR